MSDDSGPWFSVMRQSTRCAYPRKDGAQCIRRTWVQNDSDMDDSGRGKPICGVHRKAAEATR